MRTFCDVVWFACESNRDRCFCAVGLSLFSIRRDFLCSYKLFKRLSKYKINISTVFILIIWLFSENRIRQGFGTERTISVWESLDIPDDWKSKRISNESKSFIFVIWLDFLSE
jgi:hypothetical protein